MTSESRFWIEFLEVTKRYGENLAVDRLTMFIRPGTVFCLLGRNGAGKTTALQMLMGLKNPTAGDIRILGTSVLSPRIHEVRRTVGYLAEAPTLYPQLTGREFLRFVTGLHGRSVEVPAAVEDGLSRFSMADRADAPISSYSLGMKKKVALLAATVQDPHVLVLDEPTGGLDADGVREVKRLIVRQRSRNRVVLFTTHQLTLAEQMSDQLAILDRGGLCFVGSPQRLRVRHGRDANEPLEDVFFRMTDSRPDPRESAIEPDSRRD